MGMQQQAERFGARIEYDEVQELSLTDGGCQTVRLASGDTIEAEALILATGASPRYLGIPSEEAAPEQGGLRLRDLRRRILPERSGRRPRRRRFRPWKRRSS